MILSASVSRLLISQMFAQVITGVEQLISHQCREQLSSVFTYGSHSIKQENHGQSS